MKNAQKPEKISLGSLLNQLKEGRYVIPDFQREFEWEPWDIRDLIKSILLDYYIGTLLLWKGTDKNFSAMSCEEVFGHEGTKRPEYIVLDGQQRLTAIYYAFIGPNVFFPRRKSAVSFYVKLDRLSEENYDECIEYQFVGKKWRLFNQTPKLQFERKMFPVSLLGKGPRAVMSWIDGFGAYWLNKAEQAESEGDLAEAKEFRDIAAYGKVFDTEIDELERDYHISYIELDKELAVDKVCDIFTQINSKGIRLDIFDLLNALLKPKEIQLKAMWREVSGELDFLGTPKMNVYVLQVMSILLQAYCSSKYLYYLIPGQSKTIRNADGSKSQIVLIEDKDDFLYHWGEATEALSLAIEALRNPRDYGAINSSFIPYPSIVPAFAGIRRYARQNGLLSRVDVNQKIRKWYWASIFTNRYSSAVESTSTRDFMAMQRWFNDDNDIPSAIQEFESGFRQLDLINENRKGTAIYNAIINLLIIRGAKDLGTFQYPETNELDDHHIVPQSWGKNKVGPEIHSVLNKTPISLHTNRQILSDRLPNEYLKELFDNNDEKAVRDILASHFISEEATAVLLRADFGPDDYQEFLRERQKAIIEGIQELLIESEVSRDKPIRELDQEIESIELRLRELVAEEIGPKPQEVPQHLLARAKDRLDQMLSRDFTKRREDYQNTEAVLEFFDLRELEATITSKTQWGEFQETFGHKELMIKRFGQLAELRNALRHSRSVDDVIRKEGEAAILWFQKILRMV
ncbi:DUF262 domain-containing protein [Pseudomonadota bacterium]